MAGKKKSRRKTAKKRVQKARKPAKKKGVDEEKSMLWMAILGVAAIVIVVLIVFLLSQLQVSPSEQVFEENSEGVMVNLNPLTVGKMEKLGYVIRNGELIRGTGKTEHSERAFVSYETLDKLESIGIKVVKGELKG